MKRGIISTLLISVGIIATLAACGQTEEPEQVKTEEVQEEAAIATEVKQTDVPKTNIMKEKETEAESVEPEAEQIELSNTFHSRFGEVNGVGAHLFAFDYTDHWMETNETVSDGTEPVLEMAEFSNDRGSTITYMDFTTLGGYGNTYMNIEAEVAGDSQFTPITDLDDDGEADVQLGKMVILHGVIVGEMESNVDEDMIPTDTGGEFYAITSETEAGLHEWVDGDGGIYETFSFPYPIERFALIAQPADGTFTDAERAEVLAILESFREE